MFVVAGGEHATTQILDLDTLVWRDGEDLSVDYPSHVQFGNTFLVVGGTDSDAIYEFEPDSETWITRTERLSSEKKGFTTMMVSENVVECTT